VARLDWLRLTPEPGPNEGLYSACSCAPGDIRASGGPAIMNRKRRDNDHRSA